MNKAQIVELLQRNDRAVARALVVLNNRQTADEQRSESTRYQNGKGFNAAHAKRGTSMANFFLRTGFLTPRQLAWWRAHEGRNGTMRIAIYAGQLEEEAQLKARNMQMQAAMAERVADKDAFAAQEAEQEHAAFMHKMRMPGKM